MELDRKIVCWCSAGIMVRSGVARKSLAFAANRLQTAGGKRVVTDLNLVTGYR